MFTLMPQDEVKELIKRIDKLKSSKSLKDNICSILMDTTIGGSAHCEEIAREKAAAIMEKVTDKLYRFLDTP